MSKTFAKTTAGERLYGNYKLCPYPLLATSYLTMINLVTYIEISLQQKFPCHRDDE